MKKTTLVLLLGVMTMALMSFRSAGTITGTYSVADDDPSHVSLTLLDDHMFFYRDISSPPGITVRGQWEEKKGKIILTSFTPTAPFHDTWHISSDGSIAHSRKGLTIYTLRRK